jgi:hypothetical protein
MRDLKFKDVADTSAHTWGPTTSVDPTSVDAPYSSYATGGETQPLTGAALSNSAPGHYDNALNDLGEQGMIAFRADEALSDIVRRLHGSHLEADGVC